MSGQQSQSKSGKKQKNLYLTDQARQLLALISRNMGISETAVVELLIREKAARDNVTVPTEEVALASGALPNRRRRTDVGFRQQGEGDAFEGQ